MPEPTTPLDLEAAKKRIERAHELVGELAAGSARWKMSIPADPERDSDLILAAALDDAERALAALSEAQRERDDLRAKLDKPCGECHPCTEWAAETWKQAGEHLPDVHKWREVRDELRDARNDLLNVRGILSPNGYEPKTPLPLVPTVAPAVEWLVAEVEMQRAILRRVRDLQAKAEGYDFSIDPADLLAALDGTDNTGGTDGK